MSNDSSAKGHGGVKASSAEAQVAFLKELVKNQREADVFLKDPKQYAASRRIVLSPELVQMVTDVVAHDVTLDPTLAARLGPRAMQDLIEMRGGKGTGPGVRMIPALAAAAAVVAAGAAVVMAVTAVASLVVTLVRYERNSNMGSLKGLGG